jgi:hypothetical protein
MDININEHTDGLSGIRKMELRDHIGKGYQLAETLDWCKHDEDYDIHKREELDKKVSEKKEAIVPIISSDFDDHESARRAYTSLQRETSNVEIDVYDVHYEKDNRKVTVILKPFSI